MWFSLPFLPPTYPLHLQKDETCLPRLTTALRIAEHLVLQHNPMPYQVAQQLTECCALETVVGLFEATCKMLERPWMQGAWR